MQHATLDTLTAGLGGVRQAPADNGTIELIVRRPDPGARQLLAEARLDVELGLVGDNWRTRGSRQTADGSAHPGMQITLMNCRAAALVAGPRERWILAGDQFYVDLDLSEANLPAGSRLALGSAVLEVTPEPHTGCAKFTERFGVDATRWVGSPEGRALRLRGMNCRVVQEGSVAAGDVVRKSCKRGDLQDRSYR